MRIAIVAGSAMEQVLTNLLSEGYAVGDVESLHAGVLDYSHIAIYDCSSCKHIRQLEAALEDCRYTRVALVFSRDNIPKTLVPRLDALLRAPEPWAHETAPPLTQLLQNRQAEIRPEMYPHLYPHLYAFVRRVLPNRRRLLDLLFVHGTDNRG